MRNSFIPAGLAAALALLSGPALANPFTVNATVKAQPLNSGAVDPKIFGNFIELLDDVAPGMWAELLNDRSFEGVLPASDWCYYDGSLDICDRKWDTNATWRLAKDNPFNGVYCAELAPGAEPATLTQSGLSARKDVNYNFSGYLRADGDVKASVCLKFLLPSGEWLTLGSAPLPSVSSGWQKVTAQLPANGTTDRAVFELRAEGGGHLWADKLSLMPGDNLQGWRRDVVEAIKAARPSVVRWGGSCVDPGHYAWKANIGDRDLRTPWPNKHWGRLDPADVGIDEFCQFCELTGSDPLICVSFEDGAQSAADLVEYCNKDTQTTWGARRQANGRAEPYHVKYWQIGNEISGNNPEYLRQIPEFIALMKKVDPSIQIMTSFPSQKLLNLVGKDAAFVCPHHYTPNLEDCEHSFQEISDMIDHTPGCADVKIGVTEWNIDAGLWGLGRASEETLASSLINARYLNLMMRHCDKVKIGCRSNMANSYCGAFIETSPTGDGVLKRASYWVMYLYANHYLPVPLSLEESNDRLDLFAGASDDKKSMVIFAVNSAPDPGVLSLAFDGFGGAPGISKVESVCDTLNMGQPDIMNHWETPDRIKIVDLPASTQTVNLPPLSATAIQCVVN